MFACVFVFVFDVSIFVFVFVFVFDASIFVFACAFGLTLQFGGGGVQDMQKEVEIIYLH